RHSPAIASDCAKLGLDDHTLPNLDHAGLLVGNAIYGYQALETDAHHAVGGARLARRLVQLKYALAAHQQQRSHGVPGICGEDHAIYADSDSPARRFQSAEGGPLGRDDSPGPVTHRRYSGPDPRLDRAASGPRQQAAGP